MSERIGERASASVERADLWATATGSQLHLTRTCCLGRWGRAHRVRVSDHWNPSYFDSPQFTLCAEATRYAAYQQKGEVRGE